MKQIKSISLTHLLVASHYEFHQSVVRLIVAATPEVLHIETQYPAYLAAVNLELQIINRNQYLTGTQKLEELDAQRDALLSRLYTQIDMAARSPIAEEKAAGEALRIIVSPYRGIARNEYTKETAQLRGLMRDLGTDAAAAHIDTLLAGPVVQKLRQANNQFAAAMEERVATEATRAQNQVDVTTGQQRKVVDELYKNLVLIVNSFAVAMPAAAIDEFIDLVNALLDQYKRVIASQRPGGSGNEKGTGDTGDTDNNDNN